jgi:hypothetical protein
MGCRNGENPMNIITYPEPIKLTLPRRFPYTLISFLLDFSCVQEPAAASGTGEAFTNDRALRGGVHHT